MSVFGVILVCIFPYWDCIRRDTPYSIRMRENADQNISEYEHFLCSGRAVTNLLVTNPGKIIFLRKLFSKHITFHYFYIWVLIRREFNKFNKLLHIQKYRNCRFMSEFIRLEHETVDQCFLVNIKNVFRTLPNVSHGAFCKNS